MEKIREKVSLKNKTGALHLLHAVYFLNGEDAKAYVGRREKCLFMEVLLIVISSFIFFSKTSQAQSSIDGAPATLSAPVYPDTNYTFRERAADLVSRMTLEEELTQLNTHFSPAIPRLDVHQYFYWSECLHGVCAMFGNKHYGSMEGGIHATNFPVNFAAAMTWDPELIFQEAVAISDEARGFLDKSLFGVAQNNLGDSKDNYGNLTYWAPTINMDRDPRWGRTDENYGEDPFLASKMAAAYVNGLQGQTMEGQPEAKYLKVAATAKHYALNNVENNRTGISSNTSDESFRDYYTATFRYLIEKAHLAGIMTAYNSINGTPSVANTYAVDLLAKRTYGFNGYIVSDCFAVGTAYKKFPDGHFWAPPGWRAAQSDHDIVWINESNKDTLPGAAGAQAYAFRAGTILNCKGQEYVPSNIRAAIKAGILNKGIIDRGLTDVFTIRMRLGEFDPPDKVPYTKITKSVIENPAHRKLAEKIAENALVLLKNEPTSNGRALLPLDPKQLHKILILGDLAEQVTLNGGDPNFQVSAVEGLKKVLKEANPRVLVKFDKTAATTTSREPVELSEEMRSDIRDADAVIVFIGTDLAVSREGFDRASLAIPGNQEDLIYQVARQGNKNMILVMQSNGPMNISYVGHYFPSVLFSGYNGELQGLALAKVLVGDKNPSGRLSFTWYRNNWQLPSMDNYYLKPGKTRGLGRTYQYFTRNPLFFFGYGLSYTRFNFSDMVVSRNKITPDDSFMVSFNVTNTGNVPGATVAQLYVAFPKIPGLELPVRKLEGFRKTKILKPGETQKITLEIKAMQLKIWDEESLKDVVYNGRYQLQLGKNSGDIAASRKIDIQGKIIPRVIHVTIEPEDLVYKAGDSLDLRGRNKWIESDVVTNNSVPHPVADHIVEAANNDGTFADMDQMQIVYKSEDTHSATVSEDGIVHFIAPGVVTIKVTAGDISGSVVFVVE